LYRSSTKIATRFPFSSIFILLKKDRIPLVFSNFGLANPSHPPLFKERSAFLPWFSPFAKGDQGGFNGFSKNESVLKDLSLLYRPLLKIGNDFAFHFEFRETADLPYWPYWKLMV
jgi:hypothetical protein